MQPAHPIAYTFLDITRILQRNSFHYLTSIHHRIPHRLSLHPCACNAQVFQFQKCRHRFVNNNQRSILLSLHTIFNENCRVCRPLLLKCRNKQWDEPAASETCEIPKNGYGYVSNAFITCFSYCILCDSTSSCSECVDGYYLNTEKNKCLKTEGNCLEWKNATDEECHSCESGYTAKQNICYNSKCKCADGKVASYPDCNTDCSTNCRVCSASDVCTECNV